MFSRISGGNSSFFEYEDKPTRRVKTKTKYFVESDDMSKYKTFINLHTEPNDSQINTVNATPLTKQNNREKLKPHKL